MKSIFFDLAPLEAWNRKEIEGLLIAAEPFAQNHRLASSREHADYSVGFSGPHFGQPLHKLLSVKPSPDFVWDTSDLPVGINKGLYCSLPKSLFDHNRHRTFAYNLRYNECIESFPLADAQKLYSFAGAISSGLRGRMAELFCNGQLPSDAEFRISTGPWLSMFDRSGSAIKTSYAESTRRAKFILCPRGNGVGSIRMFEAMEAQRVPVIISDRYVLPDGVDWDRCSIRLRERDIGRLDAILRKHEANWENMAAAARQEWEQRFSPKGLLDEIGRLFADLDLKNNKPKRLPIALTHIDLQMRRDIPKLIRKLIPKNRTKH